jgi:hypothetical protein
MLDGQLPLQHVAAGLVPSCKSLGHIHGFLIVDGGREVPAPHGVSMLAPLGSELPLGALECLAHDTETGTHLDHRIPKRSPAVRR